MAGYVLANDPDEVERRRMALLFAYHGPLTLTGLQSAGVESGWRCLEIGAGGGDITRWLADRVTPNGSVVAVDLETRWLEPLAGGLVDVRRGDFNELDMGTSAFDVVVAQMLLLHLPDAAQACRRFVQLAAAGSQLVIQDADFRQVALPDASPLEAQGLAVMADVMRNAGVDIALGPKLADLLNAAGATVEQLESRPCVTPSDERLAAEITAITLDRFRPRADAPAKAIDAAVSALNDTSRRFTGPTRWLVRARV